MSGFSSGKNILPAPATTIPETKNDNLITFFSKKRIKQNLLRIFTEVMPLLLQEKINSHSSWALWLITEEVESLLQKLSLSSREYAEFELIRIKQKQLEWLSSRLLLKELARQHQLQPAEIIKDSFGKPCLTSADGYVSLSHSYPYAAAIINTRTETGIDIEHSREQLLRIRHKFLSSGEEECAGNHTDKLCVYWAAKEALYKLYGRKGLILKEQIIINPFELTDSGTIEGSLLLNKTKQQYTLHYRRFEELHICYSL